MPVIQTGLQQLGNDAGWTPVWRKEISYTASANLTKVHGRHEVRGGFDFVRLTLDHWQPEVGNPRGTITSAGGLTGTTGYSTLIWNNYASFLLGLMSSYGKSVQFEEMTGRENQYGLYLADRWQVNEKLTVNLGLRYEHYPLMSRADRGLEQLDYNTFMVKLGGLGGNSKDLGIEVDKGLIAPRVGVAYRLNDSTVLRAGVIAPFNPLPWSRPMRGFYPLTIAYSDAGVNGLHRTETSRRAFRPRRIPTSQAARFRSRVAWRCARPIRTTSSAATRTRGTSSSNGACRETFR